MPSDAVMQFFEQLSSSLGATAGQLTSIQVKHHVELQNKPSSQEVWAQASLQGEASCRLAFGVSTSTALQLARAMMGETPDDAATFTPEDQELLVEFWRQSLGRASADLKPMLADMAIQYVDATAPEWQSAMAAAVTLESDKAKIEFLVQLSMEMVRRLAAAEPAATGVDEVPASAISTTVNNLDLLLDVPLAVTLRFGQRRMPLREILQLTSGSVVELDRKAEDAVDLLLDERLIARGQVVVVDGCYGLRVSEVCR